MQPADLSALEMLLLLMSSARASKWPCMLLPLQDTSCSALDTWAHTLGLRHSLLGDRSVVVLLDTYCAALDPCTTKYTIMRNG